MTELQINEQIINILDNLNVGVLYCKNDKYSTILYANDYFYSMIGYTRAEVKALFHDHFAEMVVDNVPEILIMVQDAIENGTDLNYEYRMRRKDGEIIWIHDTARYDRKYDCFYVTIMDITASKKIESEREKLLTYLEYIPNKITIFDADGKISYRNEKARAVGSHTAQAETFEDLVKDFVIGKEYSQICYAWDRGTPIGYETRFVNEQGGMEHDSNYLIPIIDGEKHIKNYMQISEDLQMKDSLTSFPTRGRFEAYYKTLVERLEPNEVFLCLMDMDDFKEINDQYGHLVGDEAIRFVGKKLLEQLGRHDYICRYGGDEFMLLLVDVTVDEVRERMEHMLEYTRKTMRIGGVDIQLKFSIGVVSNHGKRTSYDEMMKKADHALYQIKSGQKGGFHIYQEEE